MLWPWYSAKALCLGQDLQPSWKRKKAKQALCMLKHRAQAWLSNRLLQPLCRNQVYRVRQGVARGFRVQGGLFFLPKPPTAEEAFLTNCDWTGKVVYDVGAFLGHFTLFFAQAVKPEGCVVAFEPNPENRRAMEVNIALNHLDNVRIEPVALGNRPDVATLVVPDGERAMGTLLEQKFPKLRYAARVCGISVDTLDAYRMAHALPAPNFIKIDVEGAEGMVLEGMTRTIAECRPQLFIEVHDMAKGDPMAAAQQLFESLRNMDYSMYHVEQDRTLEAFDSELLLKGHLFCR